MVTPRSLFNGACPLPYSLITSLKRKIRQISLLQFPAQCVAIVKTSIVIESEMSALAILACQELSQVFLRSALTLFAIALIPPSEKAPGAWPCL